MRASDTLLADMMRWPDECHVVAIPLRFGVTVRVSVPHEIKPMEAKKVARVVASLAKILKEGDILRA